MRDFSVRNNKKIHEHATGRKCDNDECGGELHDTIINFGEPLRERNVATGFWNGQNADLMIAMGSSLRVYPAANIPV